MTRILVFLVAVALNACDTFVSPRVACDTVTVGFNYKAKADRAGGFCAIPDAVFFTISHAPRVDVLWAAENNSAPCGDPGKSDRTCTVSDVSLVGTKVQVTRGSGAIRLCAGVGCDAASGTARITQVIDGKGALSYESFLSTEAAGLVAAAGGEAGYKGTFATEEYGPGNACDVLIDAKVTCEEPTTGP